MKKLILFVFSLLVTITLFNCTLENNNNDNTTQGGKWSLVNASGGIAGENTNLEKDQITWVFDEFNNTIIVEENVEGLSYALPEGTYSYSIQNINNADFLFVDGDEYGDIIVGRNTFTIDQNSTSTNTSNADMYIYKFAR
jgi:hypothetical protein